MIYLQLLALAVLCWTWYKLRPTQTIYFTNIFEIRDNIVVTLNGKKLKQNTDYTVAEDNVIVFHSPDLSGEATITWYRKEPA